MKFLRTCGVALILLGGIGGCGLLSINEFRPVAYYDLGSVSPELRYDMHGFSIGAWSGALPSTRRLIVRDGAQHLEELEFHAWIQYPPQLLNAFLLQTSGNAAGTRGEIIGELRQFELDRARRMAWLTVLFRIGDRPAEMRTYKQEWRGGEPGDAAAAMADCAAQLAAELSRRTAE